MEGESRQDPFLAQMTVRRGRGVERQVTVRIYPAPEDPSDPRMYVPRDLNGQEVKLSPSEQAEAERLTFGKVVSPDLAYRLNRQRFIAQKAAARRFPKKA